MRTRKMRNYTTTMKPKRKRNGLLKDVTNLGAAGVGMTVGSSVVSSVPGAASAAVGSGIVQGAGYFGPMYGLAAVKHVINQSNKLNQRLKKRRRR